MSTSLSQILGASVAGALKSISVYELRLRAGSPLTVFTSQGVFFWGNGVFVPRPQKAERWSREQVEEAFLRACDRSVYAVEEAIRRGYLAAEGGVRIGVCGRVISRKGEVTSIADITSLCFRFPSLLLTSADKVLPYLLSPSGRLLSTLVLSPAGAGKTTLLRGLAHRLSQKEGANVLVIDERRELSAVEGDGASLLSQADVLLDCEKKYGFYTGVRVMCPDAVIADELQSDSDLEGVRYAITAGASVAASLHASDITALKGCPLPLYGLFERYVVLSARLGRGTVEGVYDSELRMVYAPQ